MKRRDAVPKIRSGRIMEQRSAALERRMKRVSFLLEDLLETFEARISATLEQGANLQAALITDALDRWLADNELQRAKEQTENEPELTHSDRAPKSPLAPPDWLVKK